MPHFSQLSIDRLNTCDCRLQKVFLEVIKHFDCAVIWGHRSEEDQNSAYAQGFSKLKWPESKHNSLPSKAVDVVPYPIDWADRARFYFFAGHVQMTAKMMDMKLRWGGDWDGDTEVADQTFFDLAHFELVD